MRTPLFIVVAYVMMVGGCVFLGALILYGIVSAIMTGVGG